MIEESEQRGDDSEEDEPVVETAEDKFVDPELFHGVTHQELSDSLELEAQEQHRH